MSAFDSPSPEECHSERNFRPGGARRRKPVRLPAAGASQMLLIRIAPGDTGLFRYLLEGGGGHLAMLTVLDPKKALFKLLFSPHQREELFELLQGMKQTVPFEMADWPFQTQSPETAGKEDPA